MSTGVNPTPIGGKLGEFVHQQLELAQNLLARPGEKRHKGVHEARKCMRRARAAVLMLAPKRSDAASRFDRSLAKLCRSLSSLRDAQALNEALARLGRAKSNSEATSPPIDQSLLSRALVSAQAIRAQALEQALLDDPELSARRNKLQRLIADSAALPWQALSAQDLVAALQHSEQRVHKASGRAAKDTKDNVLWHSFRKRVRRLRHQRDILEQTLPQLFAEHAPAHKSGNSRAQELGESQDDALLLQFCKQPSQFENDVRLGLRAVAKARLKQTRLAHAKPGAE